MTLQILGSSSAGNCYLLDDGNDILMLECGISFKDVQKAVNFAVSRIIGCVVSHEHGDHTKAAKNVLKSQIPMYASKGTLEALDLQGHNLAHAVPELAQVQLGKFTVRPFKTQHDAAEPFGFLIYHPEMGLTMFATDTYYLHYKFAGLNNVLLECNYRRDILDKNVEDGLLHEKVKERTIKSHLEFETCKEILLVNDLSQVNNIVLIHLSSGNADPVAFQADMQAAVAHNVTIARPGLTMNFNKSPF